MKISHIFAHLIGLTLLVAIVSGHFFHSPKRLNDFQSKSDLMEYIKKFNMHNSNDWGRLGTTRFGKRSFLQNDEETSDNNAEIGSIENIDLVDSKRMQVIAKFKSLIEELMK